MWIIILNWVFRAIILLANSWLFISIIRSGEVNKIYLFLLMYFLILNDCLGYFVNIFHDIPSYFKNQSILNPKSFLYGMAVSILCCQWFFHLFFLPVFSLLHFTALFYPFAFRRFTIRALFILILFLYLLTAAVTAPLFTSCCGFVYQKDYNYWYFDYAKPYTWLYQAGNSYIQSFCVVIMIICNLAICLRLYKLRNKNLFVAQSSFVVASGQQTDLTDRTTDRVLEPRRRSTMGPEVWLAVSFVMLSGCFFASSLCFNLLMGSANPALYFIFRTQNLFGSLVLLITDHLNHSKWIVYCLGNRHIRKMFTSPSRVFGC